MARASKVSLETISLETWAWTLERLAVSDPRQFFGFVRVSFLFRGIYEYTLYIYIYDVYIHAYVMYACVYIYIYIYIYIHILRGSVHVLLLFRGNPASGKPGS